MEVHKAAFKRKENSDLRFVVARDATAALFRFETSRHGDLATSDGFHQTRDDLVSGARHLALEFIVILGRQFGLLQLELEINGLVLVKEANDERVATVALFDWRIHRNDEEHLTMI